MLICSFLNAVDDPDLKEIPAFLSIPRCKNTKEACKLVRTVSRNRHLYYRNRRFTSKLSIVPGFNMDNEDQIDLT